MIDPSDIVAGVLKCWQYLALISSFHTSTAAGVTPDVLGDRVVLQNAQLSNNVTLLAKGYRYLIVLPSL